MTGVLLRDEDAEHRETRPREDTGEEKTEGEASGGSSKAQPASGTGGKPKASVVRQLQADLLISHNPAAQNEAWMPFLPTQNLH